MKIRKRHNKVTASLVCIVVLIGLLLGGCNQNKNIVSSVIKSEIYNELDESFDSEVKSGMGFYKIAENENYILSINGATTEIAVECKYDGRMWYSNPVNRSEDTIASGDNKEELSSQLKLSYTINEKLDIMNNFSDSIMLNQFDFQKIENGIRVNFKIGSKPITYLVPKVLSVERFQEITGKSDDEGRAFLKQFYNFVSLNTITGSDVALYTNAFPILKDRDIYFFADITNPDGPPAGDYIMQKMEDIFKKCGYTANDLDQDNKSNKVKVDKQQNPYMEMSIEYIMDQEGLTVRVPKDSITYDRSYMNLTQVEVLPFFGAMDTKKTGYIFVPDGSGALINLNNGKHDYEPYIKNIYGEDASVPKSVVLSNEDSQIHLPVFGMKDETGAFYSVIEQGDAVAKIHADISGRTSNYNAVWSSFELISSGIEQNSIMSVSGITSYQKKPLDSDLQIKYMFLSGGKASYSGMASGYQRYLLDHNLINKKADIDSHNFNFSVIGSARYKTTFLGIPYESQKKLTGYLQAKEILKALKDKGVKNINMQYLAWANDGEDNREFSNIDYIHSLGGKKDFESLVKYLLESEVNLFPDVNFNYARGNMFYNMFVAKKNGARSITNSLGYQYNHNFSDYEINEQSKKLIISPNAFSHIIQKFCGDFSKTTIQSISLGETGMSLNSDFNQDNLCDRQSAKNKTVELMRKLTDQGYTLAVDGANAYTWKYASHINKVPAISGENYLFDSSVPFMQMVLHGIISYSSEPLNMGNDYQNNILRLFETGTNPSFEWIYENNFELSGTFSDYYGVSYQDWIDLSVELYHDYSDVYKDYSTKKIIDHIEIAKNVYKTVFEDNAYLITNYNNEDVTVNEVTVQKSGYCFLKG